MQTLRQSLLRASISSQLSVSAGTASEAVTVTSGRGLKSAGGSPASLSQRQAVKDAGQGAPVPQVQTRQFAEAARLLPEEDPAARSYGDATTSGRCRPPCIALYISWSSRGRRRTGKQYLRHGQTAQRKIGDLSDTEHGMG